MKDVGTYVPYIHMYMTPYAYDAWQLASKNANDGRCGSTLYSL